MGADSPHVTISAATLAGGDNNQDRYGFGEGWAFVLDGASSFATTQPDHDGGWYAERLKHALVHELTRRPDGATAAIVASAIKAAASAHENPETCPTSTIALARWSDEAVEAYVLGDSSVALISPDSEEVLTDDRLARIAAATRQAYRSRLRTGCGFDQRHRELLQNLQREQAVRQNRPNGYWIAGSDPAAAQNGLLETRPRHSLCGLVLATDGASNGRRYGAFETWNSFDLSQPEKHLLDVEVAEESDPDGVRWPRSKMRDDKTVVAVHLSDRV